MTGCHNIRTGGKMRFHFSINIDIDSHDIYTRIKHIDLLFKFPQEKLYEIIINTLLYLLERIVFPEL